MMDIPAWGWQVLTGAAVGLIFGGAFGAWRMTRLAAQARARAVQSSRLMSVAPDSRQPAAPMPEAALDPAVVRMIERLRDQNRQLANQLRELKEAATPQAASSPESTFDLGERCTSLERQLDSERQAHQQELARLMRTLLEQFDALQAAHGEQVRALQNLLGPEADTLALRNSSQAAQQAARSAAAAFGRGP